MRSHPKRYEERLRRGRQKVYRPNAFRCCVLLRMVDECRSQAFAPGIFGDDERAQERIGAIEFKADESCWRAVGTDEEEVF